MPAKTLPHVMHAFHLSHKDTPTRLASPVFVEATGVSTRYVQGLESLFSSILAIALLYYSLSQSARGTC
jgi:hypothetical protein